MLKTLLSRLTNQSAIQTTTNMHYRIHCGLNIPSGGVVSESDITDYLNDTVAPLLPCFTVTRGTGYWKGEQEQTLTIEVYSDNKVETRLAIDTIAYTYRNRFTQESVAILATPLCSGALSFI